MVVFMFLVSWVTMESCLGSRLRVGEVFCAQLWMDRRVCYILGRTSWKR